MEKNEQMIRFLHTGDWQLGITRHFFSEGVQERFAQSRFDAVRELGRIAELLHRHLNGIRRRYMTPMVKEGLLCLKFENEPNRTDRPYTTKERKTEM